jgi:hypothetical protein
MVIQRRDGQGRMLLTDRDKQLLLSLGTVGWLCPLALEWMHFPERQARWADHLETRKVNPKAHYLVSRALYRRLRILESAGLIHRYGCIGIHDGEAGGRDPDSYVLTEWGAEIVQEWAGDQAMKGVRRRSRSVYMIERHRELGLLYAAWVAALRRIKAEVVHWETGKYRVENPPTVKLLRDQKDGTRKHVEVPVQPHAVFTVQSPQRRTTTFVEWDAATVDRESWRERLQAYEKYLSSTDCATRYAGSHMMIQIYVPNESLRQKLVVLSAEVMPQWHPQVVVQLHERIHPLLLSDAWCYPKIIDHTVVTTSGSAKRKPVVEVRSKSLIG